MPSIAAVSAPDTPQKALLPADSVPADSVLADSVLAESLAAAVEAVEMLGASSADYDALTDAELIAGQKKLATLRGLVETRAVWLAKTLTHRSRRELGQQGLAAKQGFLSPAELIQDLTGCTKADARKLMDVGTMLDDTETAEAEQAVQAEADDSDEPACSEPTGLPWYSPISAAVATGSLSVAAAHAIRAGLGAIDTVVTAEVLRTAVLDLLAEAKTMTVDALLKRSRRARDTLDAAGIATREQKAWDDRYLRVWTSDSGQVHLNGQFPPEQGAFLLSVYDSATGPRRGGVRFVDPERAAWAKAVQDDPRSTDQLTADTFIELIKAGSTVNPDRMLGGRTPAVRVLTTATAPTPGRPTDAPAPAPTPALTSARPADAPVPASEPAHGTAAPAPEAVPEPPPEIDPTAVLVAIPDGTGHGFIEGHTDPVSQETIDRLCCTSGTLQIDFDNDGQPLNLGREQRVFTAGQRIALAARDGGCIWGDCDRPPSRTEAHHLEEWVRDHGTTDIALGILLCPPHHRLLHSQGWQIFENQGIYWLRPPASVDPGQTLIRMRSKSAAAADRHQHRDDDRH
ncbi:HNH endonuclease [Cryobacterium sp. 1639]|uniref:HNH endonuclease signature motif containing protein n=1 Tax=Cryobacterium inferilacus TaxID=2866629 RepID=UPI001C73346A|nr:HNH endonuclease signature motif containing protein [Cryobacterium sp. 1639]MBX0301160.1 HNH endonuclease [Cryobacterium sp. 1639]